MARNTKRSAAAAADAPTAAATAVEEAQTAAQSLATLGGGGGGADDTAPKKKARTTRGGAAATATAAAEEAAATETTAEAPAAAATTEATRRSTRGGGAPAATTTKEEPEAEEAAAAAPIKEDEEMAEPEPTTTTTTETAAEDATATTTAVIPPTTPSRVAGANVLASLGGSGEAKPELLDLESRIPTLPSDPVVVEVATAGGAAQHDYLLQNLVHVSLGYISWHHNTIISALFDCIVYYFESPCLLCMLRFSHLILYCFRRFPIFILHIIFAGNSSNLSSSRTIHQKPQGKIPRRPLSCLP